MGEGPGKQAESLSGCATSSGTLGTQFLSHPRAHRARPRADRGSVSSRALPSLRAGGRGGKRKKRGAARGGGRSALPPARRLAAVGAGGRFVSALLPEPGRNADLSTPGFLRQKVSSAAKHAAKLAKEGPLAVGRWQPAAAPGGPRAAPLRRPLRGAAPGRARRGAGLRAARAGLAHRRRPPRSSQRSEALSNASWKRGPAGCGGEGRDARSRAVTCGQRDGLCEP